MAGVTRAGGYKDYSSTGTSKFTPQVFSKKVLRNFYESTCFGEIANTDYSGEITGQGDTVIIRTTPAITINDYTVGGTLTYEVPEKANKTLTITQAKSWSYRADDIDVSTMDVDMLNKFSEDAGERLKIKIDTDVLAYMVGKAASTNRGNTAGAISAKVALGAAGGTNGSLAVSITKDNAVDFIVNTNLVMDEGNIPSENRWIVLPAWFVAKLKTGDLKRADVTGDSTAVIRSGLIGQIDRTKIIQSNLLYKATEGTATLFYPLAGTKEAVTFAMQLTKTESLRIPDSFGEYFRGLSVYGREVIQPTALVEGVVIYG